MNRKMYVRLVAFFSVLLLLIASIPPVLAQDKTIVLSIAITDPASQYGDDDTSDIQGATSIFADGHAKGQFVMQLPPDPVRPSLMYVLAPEEGRIECIGEVPHIMTEGTAYQRESATTFGFITHIRLILSDSRGGSLFNAFVEISLEGRVIQFDGPRVVVIPLFDPSGPPSSSWNCFSGLSSEYLVKL